jgi:hypothetical protein
MRKLASLLVLLAFTTASFATDGDKDKKKKKTEPSPKAQTKMAVMKLSPENYKMYYVSPAEGKVKVRLYDHEGNMIYAKKVKHDEGFALPYNFKDLEAGKYTFEVINQDGSALRQVVTHEELVETIELEALEANVQRLQDSKKFELLVMKPNQQDVKIRIRNEDGILVHEERVNFEKGFKRTYDLNQVEGWNYTFEIINGDEIKHLNTI